MTHGGMISFCAFLSIMCLFESILASSVSDKELLFVNILWRHGSRAQTVFPPESAYSVEEWESKGSGPGEMTMRGLSQQFRFGKLLRKEYMEKLKFLSSSYDYKEVYFLSTDYNRTIASAIANTIGMYSDKEANRRNRPSDVDWPDGYVAVPVHSNPNDLHAKFVPYKSCPKYANLEDEIMNSSEYRQFINSKEVQTVFKIISKKSGRIISTEDNLYKLWDELHTQKEEFNDFAERVPWVTDELLELMERYSQKRHHYGIYKQPFFSSGINVPFTIRKLNGGRMINEIFNRMQMKLDCYLGLRTCDEKYKHLKYFAYACHDYTLMSLFSALAINGKITDYHPDVTAALIFELYYDKVLRKPFIQMKYHRDPSSDHLEIVTPLLIGCDYNFCPLEKLEVYAKTYKFRNSYESFCGISRVKRGVKEETKANYPSQQTFNIVESLLNSTISEP